MEPKFQTSFIPKEALKETTTGRRTRRPTNLFTVIAVVLFLGAVIGAAGVFAYERLLTQSIDSKVADLERAKSEFQPQTIEELAKLSASIQTMQDLLKSHIAFSQTLALLETDTLQSVSFSSFKYLDAGGGKLTLSMKGTAPNFGSVAFQSDVFAKAPFLKEVTVSNPNLDAEGRVLFDFSAIIDPQLVSYAAALQSAQ